MSHTAVHGSKKERRRCQILLVIILCFHRNLSGQWYSIFYDLCKDLLHQLGNWDPLKECASQKYNFHHVPSIHLFFFFFCQDCFWMSHLRLLRTLYSIQRPMPNLSRCWWIYVKDIYFMNLQECVTESNFFSQLFSKLSV